MMRFLAAATKRDDVCSMDATGRCNRGINFNNLLKIFGKNVFSSLFIISGIISVIMIIVCGVTMMTSAGNPGKVTKAKKGLIGAVVGFIISLSAFAITTIIVSKVG